MASALTADQLCSERESGLLQRQRGCGISIIASLSSQVLIHLFVLLPQVRTDGRFNSVFPGNHTFVQSCLNGLNVVKIGILDMK